MTRQRLLLLALLALPLVLLAAGCGGSKKKSSGGTSTAANVKGTISMVAVWTGAEQTNFQLVLDGFKKAYPNVTVNYKSAKDPGQVISTAVAGGNPPDLAALPSPGLVRDFQSRGALKSLDFAASTIQANYPAAWADVGKINGKLYGMVFKGANKSTVWFNPKVFKDAGVTPPKTWDDLIKDAKTIKASGVDAYSIGGSDGWTLTDLFENIYLRQAGAAKYDQLTQHTIPWTDPSVKTAFQTMAQVIGDTNNIVGGTTGALQADFPTSVTQVFSTPPKAAQVFEGDFVAGVITAQTKAQPKTGFDEYSFPAIGSSGANVVMGGGDIITMFKDSPASEALVKYLATPAAAEIWAKKGGFSSPNKNVNPSVYPDDITRSIAVAMTKAQTFRFDMSDQAPAAFGGDAEFTGMQKFLKNPSDITGATAGLEAAAKKDYKK